MKDRSNNSASIASVGNKRRRDIFLNQCMLKRHIGHYCNKRTARWDASLAYSPARSIHGKTAIHEIAESTVRC